MEDLTDAVGTAASEAVAGTAAETNDASAFLSALWAKIAEYITTFGVRLIIAIVITIIGLKLIKMLTKLIERGKGYKKLTKTAQVLFKDTVKILLYFVLVITVAGLLGVSMTSMIAVLGSAGLAVGLALQGSLANLAGGFMILLFRPFEVGDFISDGSHDGTVADIGVFYTTLTTVDNKRIMIPNGALSNSAVTDFSAKETRRVDCTFSVAYGSDIDAVKEALMLIMENHDLILKDPAPFVRLTKHDESALVFTTRAWVKTADYWTVYFDMLEAAKKLFDKKGIEIPFPQVDVHLKDKK